MWYVVTMLEMVVWCLLWVLAHWGPYCKLFPFVKSVWLTRTLRLPEVFFLCVCEVRSVLVLRGVPAGAPPHPAVYVTTVLF
jgi:hypothetical protein